MKSFKDRITLIKNSRGCYILDTIKGCSITAKDKPLGCYDNCYAKLIASRYRFDFSEIIIRKLGNDNSQLRLFDFDDSTQSGNLIEEIRNIDMPFIRIGEMGDPSEDWNHTIEICKKIYIAKKPIVIITKHWNQLTESNLADIKKLDICINTSISALDNKQEIDYRLSQFNRLKNYCKSVLRVVSCDFNSDNIEGFERGKVQEKLLSNYPIIDTVFRPLKTNRLVTDGVINTQKVNFLRSKVLASMHNKNAYMGMCGNCPDMCGIIP